MCAARGIIGCLLLVKAQRETSLLLQIESARKLRWLLWRRLAKQRRNFSDLEHRIQRGMVIAGFGLCRKIPRALQEILEPHHRSNAFVQRMFVADQASALELAARGTGTPEAVRAGRRRIACDWRDCPINTWAMEYASRDRTGVFMFGRACGRAGRAASRSRQSAADRLHCRSRHRPATDARCVRSAWR